MDNKYNSKNAFYITLICNIICIATLLLSIEFFKVYNLSVFVLTPFILGSLPVLVYSRKVEINFMEALSLGIYSSITALISLLFLGIEGLVCILMSIPLAVPTICLGSILAYYIQKILKSRKKYYSILSLLIITPNTISLIDSKFENKNFNEVKTEVEINANINKVWNTLISFPSIPKPNKLYFNLGISYPKTAYISKKSKDGLITWNFTTGDVIEKITNWKENELIEYDVIKEPEMMKELSFYDIHPRHLQGYFKAIKGKFELKEINNKTIITGYTLYESNMKPNFYWTPQANFLHKEMQLLVLNNIKFISEKN